MTFEAIPETIEFIQELAKERPLNEIEEYIFSYVPKEGDDPKFISKMWIAKSLLYEGIIKINSK